ncbi:MAG: SGNH/GDSL hydrolase family protein [Flavobacteriales bacterium]|nr:SGNH/GDSL hydrolase family protein [Flavobacteriales bacterium]
MASKSPSGLSFVNVSIAVLLTAVLVEAVFRLVVFKEGTMYQNLHHGLINGTPGYASAPFLNYVNNPKLRNDRGEYQVNTMGIRYPNEIEIPKPDSTLRILFLGGSTTFGDVDDDYPMFSAIIEDSLAGKIRSIDPRFNKVECLNAGAHGLTSAELLTHYQFRHQYVEPDLVVVHAGANDAFCYCDVNGATYQPDYHNCRRVFRDITVATDVDKALMHSRAVAFVLIHLKFSEYLETTFEHNPFFSFRPGEPWHPLANDSLRSAKYNAFHNNISAIVKLASMREADVLLVPEVIDSTFMPEPFNEVLPRSLRMHCGFLESIAALEPNATYCHLSTELFTKDVFITNDDGLHVSAKGEELKAQMMEAAIVEILRSRNEKATHPL